MKLRNSMRGQTTKFSLAFHGALEHDARGIHERSNTKKCTWPSTSNAKSWRPSKEILCLTSHGVPKHKAWEFHERPSNKICLGLSWSSWAWCLRDPWGVEHFFLRLVAPWNILNMPSANCFAHGLQLSASNFQPPTFDLQKFASSPIRASKLGVRKLQDMLKRFKRGRGKFSYLGQTHVQPKKLQNSKLYKNSK